MRLYHKGAQTCLPKGREGTKVHKENLKKNWVDTNGINHKSKIKIQKSKIKNHKSQIKNQKSFSIFTQINLTAFEKGNCFGNQWFGKWPKGA